MQILQLLRDNAGRSKRPSNVVRNGTAASIYIYDVIDSFWGVSALSVIDALAQVADAKTLDVYINSPGGDVFEGRAIMAAISRFQGHTVAHIDSLCASAATSIALACKEVQMSEGAFFMIHNASGLCWGDKADMRETADLLEKVEGAIVNDYTTKTGKDEAQVRAWMDAESWFTAQEALDNGFVDSITTADKKAKNAKNAWNLSAFKKAPAALANVATPSEFTPAEITFMRALIANYEASIALAKGVLPKCESDDVGEMAEDLISCQSGQVALMNTWLDGVDDPPENATNQKPASAGFFMSTANANRLRLLIA